MLINALGFIVAFSPLSPASPVVGGSDSKLTVPARPHPLAAWLSARPARLSASCGFVVCQLRAALPLTATLLKARHKSLRLGTHFQTFLSAHRAINPHHQFSDFSSLEEHFGAHIKPTRQPSFNTSSRLS